MFKLSQTRMLVCDMAGTVIKEKGIVYDALFKTIRLINPNLLRSDINEFYGCKKSDVISYFVDKQKMNSPEVVMSNLNSEFNYYLKKEYTENPNVKLIDPNIPYLFNSLRYHGVKICLNTGYDKVIQELLIDKFDLTKCIDDYISSQEVKIGRPNPDMINKLMERNNLKDPKSVIKIGDTISDILEGKNVGCNTVGVLSGSSTKSILHKYNPDFIIDSIMDLKIN
jgi:phosphonatase-like hydrolase